MSRKTADIAFRSPGNDAGTTFGEIERLSSTIDTSGEFVPAIGSSPNFFPTLIAAWRTGKPVLLLETGKCAPRPILCEIPPGTALIKQTCGASGISRSLFFGTEQVLAEGENNITGLGLHSDRPSLAAISLAHSYGFGCLALPLLLAGVPLEITAGPMPMFLLPGLDRHPHVFLPGVPAMWKTWHQTEIAAHPAISLAISAGSPLSLDLEHSIHSENGLRVRNFYGTSETGAIAFDNSPAPRTRPDFVGNLLPAVSAKTDRSGRISVTTPARATGTDTAAWENEFDSPAYLTLDQGEVSDSRVYLSRCIGSAINVAGRKVNPDRLEAIITSLEGVTSARIKRGFSRDFERFEEIRAHITL
ncbi:MAG: AMP-binding protein, partial [Akkermansiaceae bacterium]|nr:AMP-binding protein [Akkermansiaceae bacterium]